MTERRLQVQNEFLDGQLLATHAAIRALILLLPDQVAARALVSKEVERELAEGLAGASTTDPLVRGIEATRQAILATLGHPMDPSEIKLREQHPEGHLAVGISSDGR